MKRGYERTQRVADLIQKALAPMLLEAAPDHQFSLVTITGVEMSRDLSYAKIYVSVLLDDSEEIKKMVTALNRSAKSLRYRLAQSVSLRIAPELKFVYDESTARGFRISTLINQATKNEKK